MEELAMIIARWSIDAKFGHKPEVVAQMKKWLSEIGSQIGWTPNNVRLLNGSIGVLESTIQSEVTLKDVAALSEAWDKLATIDSHHNWSKELEPHIVSGTQHWEIFRLVE
jgi:hypothetical protein